MKTRNTFESATALNWGTELVLNAFKRGIFLLKPSQGKGLKIVSLKQMLQRLPIALLQI